MSWAATILGRFFLGTFCPIDSLPLGLVVVLAPQGVDDERWMPVFMYASLSVQT